MGLTQWAGFTGDPRARIRRETYSTSVPTWCVYRAWLAIGIAGLLAGVAVVSLFAGFGSPVFLGVAAISAGGGLLAYWYGRERMLESVYAGVDAGPREAPTADGGADEASLGSDGDGPDSERRTTQATDGGETTADHDHSTGYDDWTWADRDPDDPFWSDDPGDWEDPWDWEATDPEEAAGEGRQRRKWGQSGEARGTRGGRGDWWRRERTGTDERPTVTEAYEILGLEPGADLAAVRRAYRERAKETHPDLGGDPATFIEVREAYERLRERLEED